MELSSSASPGSETRTVAGYSPTFDLWSTGGTTTGSAADRAKWVKSW